MVLNIPTELMISPTCIMISLHSTQDILHGTQDIPHGTQHIPPRYSRYSPWYSWYPPVVMNIPHGTQDIPHGTHDILPRYWTPPQSWSSHTVLEHPHHTKHTLYRVKNTNVKIRGKFQYFGSCILRLTRMFYIISITKTFDWSKNE